MVFEVALEVAVAVTASNSSTGMGGIIRVKYKKN